jgi:hypothetical protein
MPCSQAEEEGEAMGVHCSRPHDGSDPGGIGCLRSSSLQSACEVQFWAQAPGCIVRNGIGVAPLWVELWRSVSAEQDRAGPRLRRAVDADRGEALRP